jgi:hypothetical protein
MMGLGIPELLILLVVGVAWLIPIAAGVWALVTLQRLRTGQDELRTRLVAIERLLQQASKP